jgi:multidrug resistance efflux pump
VLSAIGRMKYTSFGVSGRIAEVLVSEGQEVSNRLFDSKFDLDARRADAVAAGPAGGYQEAVNGFRPEEVAAARAQAKRHGWLRTGAQRSAQTRDRRRARPQSNRSGL